MKCIYCGSGNLVREPMFSDFRTITSDTKPWRTGMNIAVCHDCGFPQAEVTQEWINSAAEIYSDYASYFQTSDCDQTVFLQGESTSRGDLFVDSVMSVCKTQTGGSVLDFGCGAGNLLRSFSRSRGDLKLYGFDLDNRELDNLKQIPNFEQLIVGDLDPSLKFDLISLSHTLEHLILPLDVMKSLRAMLNHDGHLVVAVPDCSKDPFKLLIADHCSHFSLSSLKRFLDIAGFEVVQIESRIETRECWAACRPRESQSSIDETFPTTEWISASIRWLKDVKAHAMSLTATKSFGIFGTSINALWLFGEIESDVDFFVDEDRSRLGRELFGRPVIKPGDVPVGSTVYMPFTPALARAIARRLARLDVVWAVPPGVL